MSTAYCQRILSPLLTISCHITAYLLAESYFDAFTYDGFVSICPSVHTAITPAAIMTAVGTTLSHG